MKVQWKRHFFAYASHDDDDFVGEPSLSGTKLLNPLVLSEFMSGDLPESPQM